MRCLGLGDFRGINYVAVGTDWSMVRVTVRVGWECCICQGAVGMTSVFRCFLHFLIEIIIVIIIEYKIKLIISNVHNYLERIKISNLIFPLVSLITLKNLQTLVVFKQCSQIKKFLESCSVANFYLEHFH